MEVMSHLLAVKDRQNATDKMFEPLRETVILLEQYGVTIPDQIYWQMEVGKEWVNYSNVIINSNLSTKNQNTVFIMGTFMLRVITVVLSTGTSREMEWG